MRSEAAHGLQQRLPSVGWTVTTDGKGRGFQFSHAELVEQLVVGAVGADLRQRVCRGLRQQLVAKGEGDICASNVPDPDLGNATLLERVCGFVDVERGLELAGAQGGRGRSDGGESTELDFLE